MIIRCLEKKDYQGFDNRLEILQETVVEQGMFLGKVAGDLEDKGDIDNALKIAEKRLEINKKDKYAWVDLARLLSKQENYSGAEAALEKSVKLDTKDAYTWKSLGITRDIQKNYAGAENAFHKYINISPFKKEVYGKLLEVLINDNRVPDILPILDHALSLKDAEIDFKSAIHFIRAFAFLYQQDRTPFLKDLNNETGQLGGLVEKKTLSISNGDGIFY